ncbi:PTS system fructose subfamily IIA component [Desulfovibrio sp. X2]|uniref:PTS sugar transporter subunit IIA n=1 Tax=Desulfovibrio sp. X2 TaxID=941449 RepID=UPI000358C9FA|nr:PTS fructose subfamily IIA component [Desulfovibrio sp. X2]EPR42203.1 PTS system fructose subfamily IIA component [Desulfovibrio sp. X2]
MADSATNKITGILLVTHADYGKALIDAAKFIVGDQPRLASIGVDASSDVGATVGAIKECIKELDGGNGVLILTDMFGGTPTNLSLSLLTAGKVEVITGVNLPMLIKVLQHRGQTPQEMAGLAKNAGVQGIVVAGEVLRKKIAAS